MQLQAKLHEPLQARGRANSPLDHAFEDLVNQTLDLWKVPGVAIAVVDGAHVYHEGYGVSDVVNETPVTSRTNFYTGSTTKAFTAAALALFVDDEDYQNVQWATPVTQLIRDDFVVANAWATDHLTLEDILSHRAGLPHHDQSHGRLPATDEPHDAPRAAVRDIVRQIRHLPLTAEPRTTFQYCNLMFVAAAHIIETLTGQWLGKFLRERIWEPLGMDGTYFATEDAKAASEPLAKGYRWDEHEEKYVDVPWMNLDGTSGAGSVISNVVDYSRWAQAVLERAPPLSKRSWEELTTPRSLVSAQEPMTGPLTYALGWYGGIYKGHRFLEHAGAMNAYGAELILFPDLRYAVVGFANTAGSSVFAERILLWRLIDDRLGIPPAERFDWNKKNKEVLQDGKERGHNARQRLYASLPDPPLPTTLPVTAYAGTYFNPGYQTLMIEMSTSPPSPFLAPFLDSALPTAVHPHPLPKHHLVASRSTTTWPEFLTFQHISGDFFIAWAEHNGDFGAWWPDSYPVEFRIGADGKVAEVGIKWEERLKDGEKIWLRRVGTKEEQHATEQAA